MSTLHPFVANEIHRTYEERGQSAADEDIRAGNVPSASEPTDDGMVLQHLGLDDGGAEDRMLLAEHADGGPAAVTLARDAALAGYHKRISEAYFLRRFRTESDIRANAAPREGSYILEKRDPVTGKLEFGDGQPPTGGFTPEKIADLFWKHNPSGGQPYAFCPGNRSVGWNEIAAWYVARHWFWRAKTW
jgi:hypothetical protein